VWANSYWTTVIKQLRNYLGYPGSSNVDLINSHLQHAEAPEGSSVRDAWVKTAIRELTVINSSD
jgi:hypothetical protein